MLRQSLSVIGLVLVMGGATAPVRSAEVGQTCRRPGMVRPDLPKCTLRGLPEAFDDQRDAPMPGNPPPPIPVFCDQGCYPNPGKSQGDDPDMDGREGVPPNSVGSGTR
jgi:hypothetical protein